MKVFFQENGGFFQPPDGDHRRTAQQTAELHRRVQPELPQRAQQRRQRQPVQHRAQRHTGEHIQPQLPLPDAQGEPQQQKPQHGDIQTVGKAGETPVTAAAKPHGAQQVVDHGGGRAQQCRRQVGGQLLGDVVLHISRTAGTGTSPAAPPCPRRSRRQCGRPPASRRRPATACRYAAPPR